MTQEEAYHSLAKFIQDDIYKKRWVSLNELQVASIEAILKKDSNLLLMAGTAQGKTEAAFLPAITAIENMVHPGDGIGILYISPLKALINDQFERIEALLKDTDLHITKWHGDASLYKKTRLLEEAHGIVQMTPESLEAMVTMHPDRITKLFHHLQFVIIDEIHYFIHEQRGIQLLTLLERMQGLAKCMPVRIGLSATIKNEQEAIDFLNTGSELPGKSISAKGRQQRVMCSVTETRIVKEEVPERYYKKLIVHTMGKRVLLFTNTRRQCETIIAGLKKIARENHLPDTYYVHHGSIAKNQRENTEKLMKNQQGQVLTGTTLTLELGIDIGDLDEVIQASDPISISSMVQRLGRSGRRTGKAAISFHLQHREDKGDVKKLDLSLIRSIAMIELYFREHYIEERVRLRAPFQFLAHTILSVLCEKGCLQPKKLAKEVLILQVFAEVTQEQLRDLLLHMIEKKIIMRYEDGALGLDDEGERLVNRMDFFAVFDAAESMTVYYMGAQIGMVDRAYQPGACFFLGGITWEVTSCDLKNKRIDVEEADGEADISYSGGMLQESDREIITKMHEILEEDTEYGYLDAEAKAVLFTVREKAKRFALHQEFSSDPKNSRNLIWCPRLSSRTITTLFHIFRAHDISCERIYCRETLFGLRFYQMNQTSLRQLAGKLVGKQILIDNAYAARSLKVQGKYYDLLPDNLKAREILTDVLDLNSARESLELMSRISN